MEPFDIDKIIQHKLGERNTLHQDPLESTKPFVWEGIQQRLSGGQYKKWYYLAAAAILLAISFSLVFYSLEQRHDQEITLLKRQIDQMQLEYQEQNTKLSTKNVQLTSLEQQLSEIRRQLMTLQKFATQRPYQVKTVTHTDTVYVPQVKYITLKPDIIDTKVVKDTVTEPSRRKKTDTTKTDEAIFITSSSKPAEQSTETIKLKFGPFTRGN
jgi:type II secretory pathway pseudopilin PulG